MQKVQPTAQFPVEGVPVVLGGGEYIVPALTLYDLRRLGPQIAKIDFSNLAGDGLDTVIEILVAAMRRNYPELQRDDVEKLIDLRTLGQVTEIAMGTSAAKPSEGGGNPGE